jgi:hypothetical protein
MTTNREKIFKFIRPGPRAESWIFISQTPFVPRFDMLHQIAILLHECVCLKGKKTILLDANHLSAESI